MEGVAGGFLEPFKSIGITPPRGRQGHSVPTPRHLQGSKLVHVAGRIQDKGEIMPPPPTLDPPNLPVFPPKVFPTQFSMRRDHSLGGSVSRLDRIRARCHEIGSYQMESFAEHEDEGGEEGEFTDYPFHDESWKHPSSYMTSNNTHTPNDTLGNFTGDSFLHFSFNPSVNFTSSHEPQLGGSFVRAFTNQGLHTSLNIPSIHHMQSSTGEVSSTLFPSAARNPNKAIVTIDAQSSRILMTNEITCELFGYQRGTLVGMKVQNLFTEPYRAKQHALVERNIDASGKEVLVSGKVLDAVTSYGVEFPVSVWMKKISVSSQSLRVIVVMEPVERTSASFSLDHQGIVVSCDPWFASLFGYPNTPAVMGQSIFTLIPSISLPHSLEDWEKMSSKQAVTGRTTDKTAFPLTVQFTDLSRHLSLGDLYSPSHTLPTDTSSRITTDTHPQIDSTLHPLVIGEIPVINPLNTPPSNINEGAESNGDYIINEGGENPLLRNDVITNGDIPEYINAKVIVYSALSGMVSFLPDGTIHGCNHHFSLMLFGYSQEELLKKDITFLMPDFYNHIGYIDDHGMPHPPLDDEEEEEEDGDISFPPVAERSLSPDAAFEYTKSHGHTSPIRRKNHEVQRSPARKSNPRQSPSHRYRPLNPINQPTNQMNSSNVDANISPRHQIPLSRGGDTRTNMMGGPYTMPPLIEEEEEREKKLSNRSTDIGPITQSRTVSSIDDDDDVIGTGFSLAHETEEKGGDVVSSGLKLIGVETLEFGERMREGEVAVERAMGEDGGREEMGNEEVVGEVGVRGERGMGIVRGGEVGERGVDSESSKIDNERLSEIGFKAETMEELQKVRGEGREGTDGEEEEDEEGRDQSLDPVSSTPASKSSDNGSSHVKKSDSFQEYMRSSAGAGSSDCDIYSITSMASLPEGLFQGFIRHKDGSSIAVIFQLKCVPLAGEKSVFCMWVCRDLDSDRARYVDHRHDPYWTDQVGISPEVTDEVDGLQDTHVPSLSVEETLAVGGVYSEGYNTLRSVGKGAFGFVQLAQRKSDKLMVAVKFLRKSGVLQDSWVNDEDMGIVALEISLLARLNHPNIVVLLEAYENDHYFQLVMEKHGDGLDLFEFIEKCPKVTEPLVSYMFRQVIAGLSYLHSKNILHRDVKDENIIMDQNFHMKLIDFGSAAYMEPGKLFDTFCGTLEYCSPEVLLGNSYPGPELEMWALGVTLYTLVFGENPFFDVEETISGHLQPPYLTSSGLMKVLFWLLHPHPSSRATLKDLEKDKWTNQVVDVSQFNFESVLGYPTLKHPLQDEDYMKPHPQTDPQTIDHLLDKHLHLTDSNTDSNQGDQ